MKTIKLLMVLTLLFTGGVLNAQKDISEKRFYYGFDEKIEIYRINEKVFVKTKPSVAKARYDLSIKNRISGIKTEWQGEKILTKFHLQKAKLTKIYESYYILYIFSADGSMVYGTLFI
jgi:hypothetical protein